MSVEKAREFHEARNQKIVDEAEARGDKHVDLSMTREEMYELMDAYARQYAAGELREVIQKWSTAERTDLFHDWLEARAAELEG